MQVRVPDLDDEALHLPVVRRQGMPRGACQSPRDIHGLQGTYLRDEISKAGRVTRGVLQGACYKG